MPPSEARKRIQLDPRVIVQFDPRVRIHVMHAWDYAYRAARRGRWEEIARDRERFRLRIEKLGKIIEPVLVKKCALLAAACRSTFASAQ